jgi:hypothetical protein
MPDELGELSVSTLADTVRVMTIAVSVLALVGFVFVRSRSTVYRPTRFVAALVVLVAVLVLMTITIVSMLQVSGSLTK